MSEWKEAIKLAISISLLTAAIGLIFNIIDITMLYANSINESIARTIVTSNLDDYNDKVVDRNMARNIARRYYFDIDVRYYDIPIKSNEDIKNKIVNRGDYKIKVLKDDNDTKYLNIERY